jgi:hypothetical protein
MSILVHAGVMISIGLLVVKREMVQMKKRMAALKAVDSLTSKDDIKAVEEAREDLKQGKTVSLAQAKKNS